MPTLENRTQLAAALVPQTDPEGRQVLVLIAKYTISFVSSNSCAASAGQVGIQLVDEPFGDPAAGIIAVPSDLADCKPAGEIIVIGPSTQAGQARLRGRTIAVSCGELNFSSDALDPWPFGPVARTDPRRLRHAGDFDDAWRRHRMPLLPVGFDQRYHQAAPPAQVRQGYFHGDEILYVKGLYEQLELASCRLPAKSLLVSGNVRQHYFSDVAALDTIIIWSDEPSISLVWRYVVRPSRKLEEVGTVSIALIRCQTARELYGKP